MIGARFFVALTLAAALGCAPRRSAWQPRAVTEASASAYAVVWGGTPLRMRPDARSPTVRVPRAGAGPDDFVTFRVPRARDGWVELETLGADDEAHCAPDLPGFTGVRVRFYVREQELARVSTRELDQRFDDGTELHLVRGVPMLADAPRGQARAALGAFSVAVSGGVSGTRYLPSEPAPTPREGATLDAAGIEAALLDEGGPFRASPDARVAARVFAAGEGDDRLELSTRCGRFVVRAPAGLLRPARGWLTGRFDGPPRVGPGAPVYFANGLEAGATSAGITLGGAELERGDGRRCFSFGGTADAPGVPLCFDDADLDERDEAGLARDLSRP